MNLDLEAMKRKRMKGFDLTISVQPTMDEGDDGEEGPESEKDLAPEVKGAENEMMAPPNPDMNQMDGMEDMLGAMPRQSMMKKKLAMKKPEQGFGP